MLRLRYRQQRPCHILGKWLKEAPDNTLTIGQINGKMKRHSKFKPNDRRVQVDGNDKPVGISYRLNQFIWNLTTGNDGHGGNIINPIYKGGVLHAYKLEHPEWMNDFGQNIITTEQRLAHSIATGEEFMMHPPATWLKLNGSTNVMVVMPSKEELKEISSLVPIQAPVEAIIEAKGKKAREEAAAKFLLGTSGSPSTPAAKETKKASKKDAQKRGRPSGSKNKPKKEILAIGNSAGEEITEKNEEVAA